MAILKQIWKEETNKIKKLEGKARYKYIWDYYKIPILALAFLIFFIGYIINMLHNSIADHWIYVTYVNTTKDLGNNSELWKKYVAYTGYDVTEKRVEFNSDSYFNYLENKAQGNKYYEMLITYISAGTLDAVVMEKEALTSLAESGWFLDLSNESCAEIMEKYSDRVIYCTPLDEALQGQLIPVAIDISDSILMSDYKIYPEGTQYALSIGAMSHNQEAVLKFLDMILEE